MPQGMADAGKTLPDRRATPAASGETSPKASSGRVVSSHHAAVSRSARFSAVIWLMPMLPAPSTRPRQTTKGTQLPMYPHA